MMERQLDGVVGGDGARLGPARVALSNGFVRLVLDLGRSPYQKLKTPSDAEWERRCRHERQARYHSDRN